MQKYDTKRRMFADTLSTQFRVDWSWEEIHIPKIKEGIIKSLKPCKLGEESGKLHGFFSESVRLGDELGSRHDREKGVKV